MYLLIPEWFLKYLSDYHCLKKYEGTRKMGDTRQFDILKKRRRNKNPEVEGVF